ncbi:DUF645 family protein [Vibrio cholerae]|uniref:DUF645 family protein n=1 Tax=Vibrio cholerae TaxID=666 RepID=UPI0011596A65|nr:DUF645 family protein [Vibrio cholerae]TQP93086.1 DUF645 family protein [Vibrio cholerae]HDI3197206.1 DUF645 family protein [Vibrio cholerae]HDI3264962.1 DUF645 family protein [Vibrio cholerae]
MHPFCGSVHTARLVSQKRQHRFRRAFFVGNSVIGQLNLDRLEFWLLTSQCLMLDVCLLDDFS